MAALSLNAIGREMGLTGPALYRYFASRDALLTDLIVDAYGDLAATVRGGRAGERGADAATCRAGLRGGVPGLGARPAPRYFLLYGTPVPGYVAPPETVVLARRIMAPLLAGARRPARRPPPRPLRRWSR